MAAFPINNRTAWVPLNFFAWHEAFLDDLGGHGDAQLPRNISERYGRFLVRGFDGTGNTFLVIARWELALLSPRLERLMYSGNWRRPTVTLRIRRRDFPVNRDADHPLAAQLHSVCVIAALDCGKT